ncbi:MAG: GNAT family N-acetyltransferase [Opitutae bacterium]|nr:GNAT family N-acetyltransferase [Opitutae bacterium]
MFKVPIRENTADSEIVTYSLCRHPKGFSALLDEVEDLLTRAYIRNPYFTPEWIECWWKRVEPGTKPLIVLARNDSGQLEGFWPFVERPGVLWSRGLWPMVYDEANYFVPIATKRGMKSLCFGIKAQLKEFQFFWIPLMDDSFWDKYWKEEIKQSTFLHITRVPRKTSILEPSDRTFDEFWASKMGAKSRKSLRYDQKSFREQGDCVIEVATDEKDVQAMLPASCLVEVNSWKSEQITGLYSIRGKRAFFFDLLPKLAKKARVRLTMIRIDDEPVAWEVDLLDQDFLGIHNLSFDQKWKKYSPGKQLMEINLRRAWEEGRTVDFLPGNLNYKEKIASRVEPVRELHLFKKSMRGYLAKCLIKWNMKVRKKIILRSKPTKASESLRKSLEAES